MIWGYTHFRKPPFDNRKTLLCLSNLSLSNHRKAIENHGKPCLPSGYRGFLAKKSQLQNSGMIRSTAFVNLGLAERCSRLQQLLIQSGISGPKHLCLTLPEGSLKSYDLFTHIKKTQTCGNMWLFCSTRRSSRNPKL
jgi:hypothetical protein